MTNMMHGYAEEATLVKVNTLLHLSTYTKGDFPEKQGLLIAFELPLWWLDLPKSPHLYVHDASGTRHTNTLLAV